MKREAATASASQDWGQRVGPTACPLVPLSATQAPWSTKRALDLCLGVTLLLLAVPVLLVAALLIKLESPGPVLFRQRRLGAGMEPFTMLKLRTMAVGAPAAAHRDYIACSAAGRANGDGHLQKLTDDPRVTHVGRVLRRLSIDELPQLVHVLSGRMSLVGPRPAIEYELPAYRPEHFARFAVKPGLTGLWQVSGRSRLGFLEMLDLDVEYVRRPTLALDLRIVARTPRALIGGSA